MPARLVSAMEYQIRKIVLRKDRTPDCKTDIQSGFDLRQFHDRAAMVFEETASHKPLSSDRSMQFTEDKLQSVQLLLPIKEQGDVLPSPMFERT